MAEAARLVLKNEAGKPLRREKRELRRRLLAAKRAAEDSGPVVVELSIDSMCTNIALKRMGSDPLATEILEGDIRKAMNYMKYTNPDEEGKERKLSFLERFITGIIRISPTFRRIDDLSKEGITANLKAALSILDSINENGPNKKPSR
jgi:hypothetical protein